VTTDDIVTYLRASRTRFNRHAEAADEIERLRAEVNIWMGAAERFAESDPKFDAFAYYLKARRDEAVRDDY
jgi:hypothetical protein